MRRPVTHSLVQALQVVPAFASLGDNALLKIVGASANLAWPAGRSIFEKGTPGDALYIVLSGCVGIVDVTDGTESRDRPRAAGRVLRRGVPDDGHEPLDGRPRARGQRADGLPKESLQELLEANPELDDYLRRKVEERFPESLSKLS